MTGCSNNFSDRTCKRNQYLASDWCECSSASLRNTSRFCTLPTFPLAATHINLKGLRNTHEQCSAGFKVDYDISKNPLEMQIISRNKLLATRSKIYFSVLSVFSSFTSLPYLQRPAPAPLLLSCTSSCPSAFACNEAYAGSYPSL